MERGNRRIIGIDLDNTLILYDRLFERMAVERGLLASSEGRVKRRTRDAVRRLPGGEVAWQKLQAAAYGPRIGEARLAEGARAFLRQCRRESVEVHVISHKTRHAAYDTTGTDLQQAALDWMRGQGLFGDEGLSPSAVHFLPTRRQKIGRIRELGCGWFVDDLEETFLQSGFPGGVERILFAPDPPEQAPPGVRVARCWTQIGEYVFDAAP
jgi:hypothetical protein